MGTFIFENRMVPAAATIFGQKSGHLSFPDTHSKEMLLGAHASFFAKTGIQLQPIPDFSSMTDLTLDLRRRTFVMIAAFTEMVNLVSIDIGFTEVVTYVDIDRSSFDEDTFEETYFTYPHLQNITYRYAPVIFMTEEGQRSMVGGGAPDEDDMHMSEDLHQMFGCEGSRADMFESGQDRLQFFIGAAPKLRSLKLLYEIGAYNGLAYIGNGYPIYVRYES